MTATTAIPEEVPRKDYVSTKEAQVPRPGLTWYTHTYRLRDQLG